MMMYFSMTHLLKVGEGPVDVVVSFGVETVSMDRHTRHIQSLSRKKIVYYSACTPILANTFGLCLFFLLMSH